MLVRDEQREMSGLDVRGSPAQNRHNAPPVLNYCVRVLLDGKVLTRRDLGYID